jgi:putative NADH-flavin reductase
MTTILIIGASKGIGLQTVKFALEDAFKVRALARSAAKIPITDPDLEKIAGDALDRAMVRRAIAGVDVVIQTLGVAPSLEFIFKPGRVFSEATRLLVPAMEEAGVRRLISVTGFGAGDSRNRGGFLYNAAFNTLLGRVYDDKDEQERIIRMSQLDWTIVRPVILTNGPRTGSRRALVDPTDWRSGFISRADVADFLIEQVDDSSYLRKTPVLTA